MGLFDKKYCDICGEKIGLLGNRKASDGNVCKDCARKLSPWFDDRRSSSIEDIKRQLEYREQNREEVKRFSVTREYGADNYKLFIDDTQKKFIITRNKNFADTNPDVISFSQIRSCSVEELESRNEERYKNSEGEMVSYNPPRYTYEYAFEIHLYVDSPWFDNIDFMVNSSYVERHDMLNRYNQYRMEADNIANALNQAKMMGGTMSAPMSGGFQQPAPQQAAGWTCVCGAVNTGNFCQSCGSKKPEAGGSFQCDKCGWIPDDPSNPPKFCPQCGDSFDMADRK